jgi:hypothetical protein
MDLKRAKEILNNNREKPLNDREVQQALDLITSYSQLLIKNLLNEA